MKTFTYTFAAGQTHTLPGGNNLVLITTSSGVDIDYFKAGMNIQETAKDVEAGYQVYLPPKDGGTAFDYVEITSAGAQTVKVGISRGKGEYNVTGGTITASLVKSAQISDQADYLIASGAPRLLIGANAARRVVTVQALSTNAGTIRVGTSGVSSSRGIELQPGQTHDFYSTAAVYVYSVGGGNYAIASEVKD